jgi:hypothetical protein
MRRATMSEYVRYKLEGISPALDHQVFRSPNGLSWSVDPDLLQRHFAWSATCFTRSYHLMLAYLVLAERGLSSWATVTGYYSRFYNAKALVNLCLASWVDVDLRPANGGPKDGKRLKFLLFTGDDGTRLIERRRVCQSLLPNKSHECWWRLLDQLRHIPDLPESDAINSALQPWPFTSDRRNELNYSDVWMQGFPELEWFDVSVEQMLAHMSFASSRQDQDFTNIDRYFEGLDPENVDVADYYTDPVVALWQPIAAYLDLVNLLLPMQAVLTAPKLIALAKRALGHTMPVTLDGLCQGVLERELIKL